MPLSRLQRTALVMGAPGTPASSEDFASAVDEMGVADGEG